MRFLIHNIFSEVSEISFANFTKKSTTAVYPFPLFVVPFFHQAYAGIILGYFI
jgi:hypothetical protein